MEAEIVNWLNYPFYVCTYSGLWRDGAPGPSGQHRRPSRDPPLLFPEGLACLRVDNIQHVAESFKRVEFRLLARSQRAGARLGGEVVHAGMVRLGEAELEQCPSRSRRQLSLEAEIVRGE